MDVDDIFRCGQWAPEAGRGCDGLKKNTGCWSGSKEWGGRGENGICRSCMIMYLLQGRLEEMQLQQQEVEEEAAGGVDEVLGQEGEGGFVDEVRRGRAWIL